ncbi:hypothetical protein BDV98DRAFT_205665 [Pterulicium gracile]|uniref:Transmembrane protein n=1 Tax=Pterulicium gracile TaxID=1884261 RepID=A0A5C3QAA5_9AGAR|nr:hypothetical protein BDV98DRAFT_205665 [Pterula gracilis]
MTPNHLAAPTFNAPIRPALRNPDRDSTQYVSLCSGPRPRILSFTHDLLLYVTSPAATLPLFIRSSPCFFLTLMPVIRSPLSAVFSFCLFIFCV